MIQEKLKKREVLLVKVMLLVMPFVMHKKNAKVKKRRRSLTVC
jgi:hypothetical protein